MQPQQNCCPNVATRKLLSWFCLNAATTRWMVQCSYNEIVSSKEPQRGSRLVASTRRLFPRCKLNKIAATIQTQPLRFSIQPKRDCCIDKATKVLARCSHKEIVTSMQPQEAHCFDAATTRLVPRCSHNKLSALMHP